MSHDAFWCPECGGNRASLQICISPAPPEGTSDKEVDAFFEAHPWAAIRRVQVCDRCGYYIPAHLSELWEGMTKEDARAEWRTRYRAGAERQHPPYAHGREICHSFIDRFAQYRSLADAALAQAPVETWTRPLGGDVSDEGEMPLVVQLRHVGGNLKSRFTDLLTSDGEKPWRSRDGEFEPLDPAAATAAWDEGWTVLLVALEGLTDADLTRTITIRHAPLTVLDALLRSLAHVSYHVGQIVLLAKHHAGAAWTPLTIPRGQSDTYQAKPFEGSAYRG